MKKATIFFSVLVLTMVLLNCRTAPVIIRQPVVPAQLGASYGSIAAVLMPKPEIVVNTLIPYIDNTYTIPSASIIFEEYRKKCEGMVGQVNESIGNYFGLSNGLIYYSVYHADTKKVELNTYNVQTNERTSYPDAGPFFESTSPYGMPGASMPNGYYELYRYYNANGIEEAGIQEIDFLTNRVNYYPIETDIVLDIYTPDYSWAQYVVVSQTKLAMLVYHGNVYADEESFEILVFDTQTKRYESIVQKTLRKNSERAKTWPGPVTASEGQILLLGVDLKYTVYGEEVTAYRIEKYDLTGKLVSSEVIDGLAEELEKAEDGIFEFTCKNGLYWFSGPCWATKAYQYKDGHFKMIDIGVAGDGTYNRFPQNGDIPRQMQSLRVVNNTVHYQDGSFPYLYIKGETALYIYNTLTGEMFHTILAPHPSHYIEFVDDEGNVLISTSTSTPTSFTQSCYYVKAEDIFRLMQPCQFTEDDLKP